MACSHAQTNDHLPSLSALTLTAAVPIDNPKTCTHRTRKHSDTWEHNYKYVLFLHMVKTAKCPLYAVIEDIPSNSPVREILPCPLSGLFTSLFPSKGVYIVLQKGSKECWQKLSIWHILQCLQLPAHITISNNICINSLHLTNFVIWNTATSNSVSCADWQLKAGTHQAKGRPSSNVLSLGRLSFSVCSTVGSNRMPSGFLGWLSMLTSGRRWEREF